MARIQIYQEELGEGIEMIEQTSRNGETFYGLRIWLKTCQPLLDHSTPEDDDRSAVTFWAKDEAALHDLVHEMRIAVIRGYSTARN
jgi:hypothetical protein